MLIVFLGAPGSGKTTTAAHVFAGLKDMGTNTEFVVECARTYIAQKRFVLKDGAVPVLTDEDQAIIMHQQYQMEALFTLTSNGNSITVSDSAAINGLMYLSKEPEEHIWSLIGREKELISLAFLCPLTKNREMGVDPNRIHSLEQSRKLDEKLRALIPSLNIPVVELIGRPEFRASVALNKIYEAWRK